MGLTIEQRKQKLEAIAEHVRGLLPTLAWKVFVIEDGKKSAVLMRGVLSLFGREPQLHDSRCIDLFHNGDVVVCDDSPELIGHISMRGKPENLARKFHQELAGVFGQELDTSVFGGEEAVCDCPKCRGEKAGMELAVGAQPSRPFWVDLSASNALH